MDHTSSTDRAIVRRLPQRGVYDRATIYKILDDGIVCHVGFTGQGQPYVIPTIYARLGDTLYFHGSPASRMLQLLQEGAEVCVTVTLIDGLVLARSAFHHSMNYRSVVLFGTGSVVKEDQKVEILRAISESVIPGRWADVRKPTEHELRRTLVVSMAIQEASAKVRTGPPLDDEEDYKLPVWAGIIPLRLSAAPPLGDERLHAGIEPPAYARDYRRSQGS